jgi:heme-degrading monooxygenase HmoA
MRAPHDSDRPLRPGRAAGKSIRETGLMYAVIFTARIRELDSAYRDTAERMRELATNEYGCTGFTSVTEGDLELAVSYWDSLEQIAAWKQDAEHLSAQSFGREVWYRMYSVQVVEILREYTYEA